MRKRISGLSETTLIESDYSSEKNVATGKFQVSSENVDHIKREIGQLEATRYKTATNMTQHFSGLRGEVKTKIFSLLNPMERQTIRPVCTDWKDIIDEEFGIKLVVNNSTIEVLLQSGEYAVELELNSLTVPIDSTGVSFAHRLHTLRFHNIVVTYNLLPLLRNFSSTLTTLSFSHIIVDLPEQLQNLAVTANGDQVPLYLPRLSSLELNEWNMSDSVMALMEFLNSAVQYDSLASVSILLQNPPLIPLQVIFSGEVRGAPPFVQLVHKNLNTLECLKYGKPNAPLTLKFYPYGSISLDHPVQLRELVCMTQFKMDWMPLLSTQKQLVRIHIGDCRVGLWDSVRSAIRDNSSTLEVFWIAGQSFNQRWDCSIFKHCSNLRKVCVQLFMSPKINLGSLPPSVTKVNLSGCLRREEMIDLIRNLKKLESAEFSHLGINQAADVPDDRLSLDLFLMFMKLPKLNKISFLHCDWNDVDWEGVINWCSSNTSHGIFFEQLFYPLHGQEIRHGIHVQVLPNFDKSTIDITIEPPSHGIMEGMCSTLFSALTFWL